MVEITLHDSNTTTSSSKSRSGEMTAAQKDTLSMFSVGGWGMMIIMAGVASGVFAMRARGGGAAARGIIPMSSKSSSEVSFNSFTKVTGTSKIPDEAYTSQGLKPPAPGSKESPQVPPASKNPNEF